MSYARKRIAEKKEKIEIGKAQARSFSIENNSRIKKKLKGERKGNYKW
ncbi:hypothetical protein [Clostridium sp. YIM B02551]|nr:hypothetical protein [Clostridium sp. YIM B02551]